MRPARRLWLLPCVFAAAGCAQPGPLLSGRASVGTLKASVSHLEFENHQLRRQVAGLEADNRKIEQSLVQERSANGELSARLDDARALLGQRGVGADEGSAAASGSSIRSTMPAGNSTRKRRKPPFAQIPGHLDVPAPDDQDPEEGPEPGREDLGPQSRLDGPRPWLPVAGDLTAPAPSRR
jgi:hypothetical protein